MRGGRVAQIDVDQLQVLWIALVSLDDGINATTPAGKLHAHPRRDRPARACAHPERVTPSLQRASATRSA
jgi:hypothetical protein